MGIFPQGSSSRWERYLDQPGAAGCPNHHVTNKLLATTTSKKKSAAGMK
jgi:hypothetical protein